MDSLMSITAINRDYKRCLRDMERIIAQRDWRKSGYFTKATWKKLEPPLL